MKSRTPALDFNDFYSMDFCVLKYLGVWIPHATSGKYYKIYFVIINFFFCAILNLVQILNLFHQMDNLKKLSACGYVVAIACMANVRSYYFFKNRKELLSLLKFFSDEQFQPQNEHQISLARKSLDFYKKIKKLISTVCTISVISAVSTPVFYTKNELNLPFASWYPFAVSSPPVYQIVYLHQCIAVIYITYVNTYVDIIMAGFTTFIGIQCDLLCDTLYNVTDSQPPEGNVNILSCIAHHKKILCFALNTEILFNRIYLGQFVSCTSALCMALFLLTLQEEINFECLYLFFYQTSIFCLLLIPCWFSSEMCRKSENIAKAAYSCHWVTASGAFKKNLIILIHKSQKPIRFYAVGLFQISVETFMTIVRSSFSFYTVLNTLELKEE
ncbi:odorant receptor 10 [Leptinotarsa decemlineata]|uniref:odorant receptor 10 n=1 Tax=Leptinotarsa decemlineata TaxID=7539 RepID=UPI003D304A6A